MVSADDLPHFFLKFNDSFSIFVSFLDDNLINCFPVLLRGSELHALSE